MWRCKGQCNCDGLCPLAERHVTDNHLIWISTGPLFWLPSSPACSVGDLQPRTAEVGAQCQVDLHVCGKLVVIGLWESLFGSSCTEAAEPVSVVKFQEWFSFETVWMVCRKQRAGCVCVCAFQVCTGVCFFVQDDVLYVCVQGHTCCECSRFFVSCLTVVYRVWWLRLGIGHSCYWVWFHCH